MEQGTGKLLKYYGWTIALAIAASLLIRVYVVEAYRIPTPAMRPTLEPGDTVFAAKKPAGLWLFSRSGGDASEAVARNQVVLYTAPDESGREYIKRVIGLPGDTVRLEDGRIVLNGKALNVNLPKNSTCGTEEITPGKVHGVCYEPPKSPSYADQKVPEGSIFVMGDLRTGPQFTSELMNKAWGMVPLADVKGQVLWTWLSIEPQTPGLSSEKFPKLRLERMFRRVE